MIATAAKEGNSVSNLIEYLYSGREEGHKAADKQASMITKHALLPSPRDYTDRAAIDRLKKDFQAPMLQYNKKNNSPKRERMGHHVLSFSKDDMKHMTAEKVKTITEDYIKLAGLDKTQHFAVSHHDTDSFHVHIAFSRVTEDQKIYKNGQEKNKTIERGIALNIKHDLKLEGNQKIVAQTHQVVKLLSEMDKFDDKKKQVPELDKARNLHHLKVLCKQSNKQFLESKNTVQIGNREYQKAVILGICKRNNDAFKDKSQEEEDLRGSYRTEASKDTIHIQKLRNSVPELSQARSFSELEKLCKNAGKHFENKDEIVTIGNDKFAEKDVTNVIRANNTEQSLTNGFVANSEQQGKQKTEKGIVKGLVDEIAASLSPPGGAQSMKEEYPQRLRRKRKGASHNLKSKKAKEKSTSKFKGQSLL